jgi:hypothetical protein
MIRLLFFSLLLIHILGAAEFETTFENSNFTLSTPIDGNGERTLVNYNRFRVIESVNEENWFITAIGDIENYLGEKYIDSASFQAFSSVRSDTPFSTQTSAYDYGNGEVYAQIHRLYGGYVDEKHRISLGLQKISMGVGRIWNPTDLFNPRNPLALEPDEVYGVFSLLYTYSPSDLSQISAVGAQRSDDSFKYAGRIKGYLDVADVALDMIVADDVAMLGYELEGELFDTGVELRSEGGWFEDKLLDEKFFQALLGADYSFENSLMLAGEWLHSSKTFEEELVLGLPSGAQNNLVGSKDYLGSTLGYEFDALLYGAMAGIISADDGSFYLSPTLRYSLDDDMTLALGAMLNAGESGSEFGDLGQTYYLNFKVTF